MKTHDVLLWTGIVAALCVLVSAVIIYSASRAGDSIKTIEDPTERGLAYVAAAIVVSALLRSDNKRSDSS